MDTDVLVDEQIESGQNLLLDLARAEFDVAAAFWVRTSEGGSWQFYISSDWVDEKNVVETFRRVYPLLTRSSADWLSPADIRVINSSNPISVAAVSIRDRRPGNAPVRYHGKRLGPLDVAEAYIYPRVSWFKGLDEIRRNFPSAEIFTLPILSKDLSALEAHALIGHINASTFEGKPSGTVYFLGPKGSSVWPRAEMIFIYRPEGWNNLYRVATNSWEEVIQKDTCKKLYDFADFEILAALRSDHKRAG